MNRDPQNTSDTNATDLRLLWLAIVLLGAVFFFVGHDVQVSRFESFAPWSDSDGSMESGGNMTKGLALSLIGFFGLYLLLRRDGRPLRWTGWLPAAMVFYVAWSAASILWSSDPGLSCRKLAVLMFCVFGALGFARQFRLRDIVLIAVVVPAAFLAVGIAAELALGTFRPWSEGYRFSGTIHPNTQGAHLTVLCLASFCLARFSRRAGILADGVPLLRRSSAERNPLSQHCLFQAVAHRGEQPLFWTLFAIGLVFLLLTKSRTSCAALTVSLAALCLISASGRTRLLTISAAGFLVCSAALFVSLFGLETDETLTEIVMLGRQEESAKLTGRIPIWKELLGYVGARPLHGYGYEAFWTEKHIEEVSDDMQWPLREAHNAYLDSTLSVGLIGTATLMLIVSLGLYRAASVFRATAAAGAALTFCLLIFVVLDACLETGLVSPNFVTLIAGSGIAQLLVGEAAITSRFHAPRGNGRLTTLCVGVCHAHRRGATNGRGQPGATNGRGFMKK
ncbi:MAG: O-antigen ligase family protein [Pirellulales bacterium]|nr:O-antigen ligase family protein [Pirellulales bacterium]